MRNLHDDERMLSDLSIKYLKLSSRCLGDEVPRTGLQLDGLMLHREILDAEINGSECQV